MSTGRSRVFRKSIESWASRDSAVYAYHHESCVLFDEIDCALLLSPGRLIVCSVVVVVVGRRQHVSDDVRKKEINPRTFSRNFLRTALLVLPLSPFWFATRIIVRYKPSTSFCNPEWRTIRALLVCDVSLDNVWWNGIIHIHKLVKRCKGTTPHPQRKYISSIAVAFITKRETQAEMKRTGFFRARCP